MLIFGKIVFSPDLSKITHIDNKSTNKDNYRNNYNHNNHSRYHINHINHGGSAKLKSSVSWIRVQLTVALPTESIPLTLPPLILSSIHCNLHENHDNNHQNSNSKSNSNNHNYKTFTTTIVE